MKKAFEIFIVVFVLFNTIYYLWYVFFFDSICSRYAWKNNTDIYNSIGKLATCKDSLICYASDIDVNKTNISNSWNCSKKQNPVFWWEIYMRAVNHFINSLTR